jgi:GTPase SAR1 family protein
MDAGTWSWILPVAKDAYENREEILTHWDKFRKFFENKETTIAVTGLPGAGKSVLCDYLTGKAYQRDYQKPGKSEDLEKGKVSGKKLTINLRIVPGQDSPKKLEAFDTLFDQDSPVDGVIHVVANGFTTSRSSFAQEIASTGNNLAIYRESQFRAEIEDLNHVCDLIRKSIRTSKKPKWLLVAATKIDLYYDSIETARDRYYVGESEFTERIQKLSNQVGSDNFSWDALAVCSSLNDFVLGKKTIISKFREEQRNYFIGQFLQRIKALCEVV